MKHILVVDDLRTLTMEEETKYGLVTYARTLEAAMILINAYQEDECLEWPWEEIHLDHDLGGNDTIRPVVDILERWGYIHHPSWTRPKIVIISSNPVGRQYIRQALEKYYEVHG